MKVVILAGGLGTRISEESVYKPKPMIEIGNMPILWHIMKEYSYYGFHDFVICAGYKQHMIKEWFADYFLHTSDITFDFTRGQNEMIVHNHHTEPWKVTVVDTGLNTMTGGRIKRIRPYIGNETFMMTYGDGVCDVDIAKLVAFHRENGKIATLTAAGIPVMAHIGFTPQSVNSLGGFRVQGRGDAAGGAAGADHQGAAAAQVQAVAAGDVAHQASTVARVSPEGPTSSTRVPRRRRARTSATRWR